MGACPHVSCCIGVRYPKRYLIDWRLRHAAVEEREAKLCSWGASKAVRIPKAVCDSLRLAVGSNLSISCGTDENGPFILLRPVEESHRCYCDAPYVSIDSLFRGHEDVSQPTEADWGEDVGGEVVE